MKPLTPMFDALLEYYSRDVDSSLASDHRRDGEWSHVTWRPCERCLRAFEISDPAFEFMLRMCEACTKLRAIRVAETQPVKEPNA